MSALGEEYTKRYGKKHLSITKCFDALKDCPIGMPVDSEFNQPPQCMPDEYKNKCSVQAYWNYYIGEKHTVANPKTEKIYEYCPNNKPTNYQYEQSTRNKKLCLGNMTRANAVRP
jgi:hypothetical protein